MERQSTAARSTARQSTPARSTARQSQVAQSTGPRLDHYAEQIEVTLTAPVNPTHTVNSAGVMMGLGSGAAAATIIPMNTSRVRACFFGTFAPGTSGTYTTTATMYYGVSASNAVPPNGGAISGSTAGAVVMNEVTTSASKYSLQHGGNLKRSHRWSLLV